LALPDLLCIELGGLLLCAGEAYLESFDLAEPPLLFCIGDSGDQVVADLGKPCPLGGPGQVGGASI
jgi:hypothetical protein